MPDLPPDELTMTDVVQCPICEGWFEEHGEENIIVHFLNEHPYSPQAIAIRIATGAQ